ncbi:MAG: hypothetical protein JO042_08410, partial [Sinobacteraceae bacterium]|nr:hypothetical protein [Nevskiaceae bacterium]
MNVHDPQTLIIIAIIVVAIIAAIVLIARERKRVQSRRLQQKFGPEYSRVVRTAGDRERAEAELKARESRVERLKLVTLPPAEAARFTEQWKLLQARFVDDPTAVVVEAERLV